MENLELAEQSNSKSPMEDSVEQCARVLMRRLFRVLKACGFSEEQLLALSSHSASQIESIPAAQFSRVTARLGLICCDVVLKWRRDCRFVNQSGNPRVLAFAEESPSIVELVQMVVPGENPQVVIGALMELEVVCATEDGKFELISDSVVACSGRDRPSIARESVLEHISGFLGSVEYNIFDKPSRARGKFERACYAWVPRKLAPVLENLVNSRGQEFVDVIDEWLARRSVTSAPSEDAVLVGAGAYVFIRDRLGR